MDKQFATTGTQSLQRLLHLLRIVGLYSDAGVSVAELALHSGIARPTVHRMVGCLVAEGFVERNAATKRFQLGTEAVNLGVSAVHSTPLVQRYSLLMTRLARRSGDTVFLLFRQADCAVCLHRENTAGDIHPSRMRIGERRLLGIGAGGIALLSKLPDEEIDEIYDRNRQAYAAARIGRDKLDHLVEQARASGFGIVVNKAIKGAAGVGVAFPAFTYPWAAISIGTQLARFTQARQNEMVALLVSENQNLRKPRS